MVPNSSKLGASTPGRALHPPTRWSLRTLARRLVTMKCGIVSWASSTSSAGSVGGTAFPEADAALPFAQRALPSDGAHSDPPSLASLATDLAVGADEDDSEESLDPAELTLPAPSLQATPSFQQVLQIAV